MKKGPIIAGVVVVAAAAALFLPRALKPKAVMEEEPIPVVNVQTPETGTIELYRDLVGSVEPSDVVYLYPKASGEVLEVFVKPGDTVKEGQNICKIDTKQVESAKLSLDSAEIARNDAQTNLDRQQALFASGDIASAALEQAQTQAKNTQIQYENAKLNYDHQVEYSNVTASIGGKIEICDIEVHDNVSQQTLLCVISGAGSKSVTFSVPEKIVNQMAVGDPVTIEKSGSEYQGTVTEVSSMIDTATGLFKIKANVEDGGALASGSTVKLNALSDRAENVMTLPVDAIYYSGGDAYLYTYVDGTVHRVPVEVGIYDSEKIQILSGINASDQVITTWSSELFEGSKVQLADAAGSQATAAAAESESQTDVNTTETKAE